MGLANEPNYDLARNPAMLRETRSALAATGIRLHDIELARITDGMEVKSYAHGWSWERNWAPAASFAAFGRRIGLTRWMR